MRILFLTSLLCCVLMVQVKTTFAQVATYDWGKKCVQQNAVKRKILFSAPVRDFSTVSEKTRVAYKRVREVLEFYKTVFNWDSIDNAGANIFLHANLWERMNRGCNGLNAFYSPINRKNHIIAIYLGHADSNLHLALDAGVIAHEFNHGVYTITQSNMIRTHELDALNESIADMMGITFKAWLWANKDLTNKTVTDDAFKLGRNFARIAASHYNKTYPGGAMRNLANPAEQGHPDHVSVVTPNQEIHTWAGVTNLAFYLMAQGGRHPTGKSDIRVKAMGLKKASAIVFYVLRHRLPFSDMRSFARAMEKAARKIHGRDAAEVSTTHNAFAAVGLFDSAVNPTSPPKSKKTETKPKPQPQTQTRTQTQTQPGPAPQPTPKSKPKKPAKKKAPRQPEPSSPPAGREVSTRAFTLSGKTFALIFIIMIGTMITSVVYMGKRKTARKHKSVPTPAAVQPASRRGMAAETVKLAGDAMSTEVVLSDRQGSASSVSCRLQVGNESFGLQLDAEPLCLGRMSENLPGKLSSLLNEDETISRKHCDIWYQAAKNEIVIRCLSANGMTANSTPVATGEQVSIRFDRAINLKLGGTQLTISKR